MITVWCGNGGDYEYERERYWWTLWIRRNITGGVEPFDIRPNREADRADIYFHNSEDELAFRLKAPEYIGWQDPLQPRQDSV